ncbi:sugar ABC transporter substrate-binding protein [Bifidobacterium sp. ESL0732]|uniref:ABC transporter substrate-binding protein n=1 Tax=Bifidobacterium sp. ESL0732 TaxID=2983222 RepID=UPI0023F7EEAC|nr:sugar ABC transporter substrate-binding protein [Bifidobacterium sp. ESL0732]WEV63581.1 sugar ABC transporter substrate-binding protein [Bifidobacterium sp. ESL0732]
MISSKKMIAIVGVAAMVSSVAACGGSQSSKSSGGKVQVSFQTWNLKNDKYTPYFTKLIADYEKANPNVRIKWMDQPADNYEEKLSSQAASGELPDIVDAGVVHQIGLAKAGALMNIDKEDPNAKNDYLPNAWEAVTFQGKKLKKGAYGFPWYVNDGPYYYNADVMKKCNLDPNKLPKTWDDFFAAGKTMVQSGCGAYLTSQQPQVMEFAGAGVPIMNKDHTKFIFNSPKGVEFLQKYIDLYQSKGMPPESLDANWSQQGNYFQRGSIMTLAGSAYSAADFKKNSPDLYNHLTVGPRLNYDGRSTSVSYEMLSVSATTKHKAETLKFVKYVTNNKNQLEFAKLSNTYPSSKKGLDDPYYKNIKDDDLQGKALKITLDGVKHGYMARPAQLTDQGGSVYLKQQIALALQGKQSAKEALDKAAQFANEKLDK